METKVQGTQKEGGGQVAGGGGLGAPPSSVAGSQPPEPEGRKRPIEAEGDQLALSGTFLLTKPGCGFIHNSSP